MRLKGNAAATTGFPTGRCSESSRALSMGVGAEACVVAGAESKLGADAACGSCSEIFELSKAGSSGGMPMALGLNVGNESIVSEDASRLGEEVACENSEASDGSGACWGAILRDFQTSRAFQAWVLRGSERYLGLPQPEGDPKVRSDLWFQNRPSLSGYTDLLWSGIRF